MSGRIRLRRRGLGRRGALGQRCSALTAELLACGIRRSAGAAHGREPRATLPAELLPRRVIVLAPRTFHCVVCVLRLRGPPSLAQFAPSLLNVPLLPSDAILATAPTPLRR